MNTKPIVSVIIPVYNLDKYLDSCLESVKAQTFSSFEAIIVDDGSTDSSAEVVRRHSAQDSRLKLVSTPNCGVARARETGLAHAQGQYICFLDGDDLLMPDTLEVLTQKIAKNGGYDIVCCDFKRICKTYEAPVRHARIDDMQGLEFLIASLRHSIPVNVWGRLYKRSLFDAEIRHYPLRLGQDTVINIQIGCRQPRVRFIDHIGYGYVQRAGSSNHRNFDIAYCQTFSKTVGEILNHHNSALHGKAELLHLINTLRWYFVYISKSSSPWVGDSEFVQQLRTDTNRYHAALKPYYSCGKLLLLRMDSRRWMRPVVIGLVTLMRWNNSLCRRFSH